MTPDPADNAEARSRRAKVDDLIVITATVALFIVLMFFITTIVDVLRILGVEPDIAGGLIALAIIVPITIAFSWLLAYGLRRKATKRLASSI
jgi:hypothetical protein